jgi:uncharacterized membrane protein YdbT with pleckstrin-like domain
MPLIAVRSHRIWKIYAPCFYNSSLIKNGQENAMGYIEETLSNSETIVRRAHFHWTYYLAAWLALIFLGVFLIGIYLFVSIMVRIWKTEIAVTNHRVVHKTGLFTRNTHELELDSVEGVELQQSFLGRLFGYGKLVISGTGVEDVVTPDIAAPMEFRKAIDEAANAREEVVIKPDTNLDATQELSA